MAGDRPAEKRIKDFDEVDTGLSMQNAVLEALRCLACVIPKCVEGCPVNIDIPGFVGAIASNDMETAAEILRGDNMLPAICGRVCPQETQCEGSCILGKKEKPVKIGALERFVADWEREKGVKLPETAPPSGRRVAIVGSGPAGLTAAAELAKAGHEVLIFESLHEAGGVLTYGIPSFRLPKEIVREEIRMVQDLGVEIRTNHVVGRSVPVEELLSYDAVFLASGAGLPYFMGIEGEILNGVYSANEFLTRVNLMHAERFPEFDTPVKKGGQVVVVGAGNVAMDAARVARRMGGEVKLVYRRREEDFPARLAEVEHACEEGIKFVCCTNPVRITGSEGRITALKCVRMEMCDPDESGRPIPKPIEDSEFTIDADVCIIAIGQGPNPLIPSLLPGLETGRKGNVVVDNEGRTSIPHVFAAGDITTGAATVISAMGSAKTAAAAINKMLSGK